MKFAVDKHQSVPQSDTNILMEMVKHSQTFHNSKFAIFLQYLKNNLELKMIFCLQINVRVSYKLISTLWASKIFSKVILVTCFVLDFPLANLF